MADSPNLILPYIQASQAQKHVTHNEAIRLLDGMVQLSVISQGLTTPPGSPSDGDRYIVGSSATGAWTGWDLNVAFWVDGAWMRLIPRVGWLAYVIGSSAFFMWNGSGWGALSSSIGAASFPDNAFSVVGSVDPTKVAQFEVDGFTAATTRLFTLPNASGTIATLNGIAQTFQNSLTFSGQTTFTTATNTFGNSAAASTTGLAVGATTSGLTKTINIGTAGLSGSTSNIAIGSAIAGALGTLTINSPIVTMMNGMTLNPMASPPASPTDGTIWYDSTLAKFRGQQNGAAVDVVQFPLGIFGDGSDGAVTISSGTTTLTRDMFYQNLTINGTGILATAGFKVYVSGTLDISAAAAGSIINNGGAGGAGATAGTAGTSGAAPGLGTTLANGTINAAGAGGVAAGVAGAAAGGVSGVIGGGHGIGGAGGLGSGGAGGAGSPASTTTAIGASFRRYLPEFIRIIAGAIGMWSTCRTASGGGGGGDATSGAGGGGCGGQGGAVAIYANVIARGTNVAVGIIRALGGAAGAGGSATAGNRGGGGGGSGGPGGFVYICYALLTGSTIANAIDVTGGNGGAGGNGFGTGIGGGGGGSGGRGRVVLVDIDAASGSELVPDNGAAGTTTATITGGAGATATVSRLNL